MRETASSNFSYANLNRSTSGIAAISQGIGEKNRHVGASSSPTWKERASNNFQGVDPVETEKSAAAGESLRKDLRDQIEQRKRD